MRWLPSSTVSPCNRARLIFDVWTKAFPVDGVNLLVRRQDIDGHWIDYHQFERPSANGWFILSDSTTGKLRMCDLRPCGWMVVRDMSRDSLSAVAAPITPDIPISFFDHTC